MKALHCIPVLLLALLSSCSTAPSKNEKTSVPETVLLTYHVKPGKEKELQETLSRAWKIYQKEHLVLSRPHVIVQANENGDRKRFVEIFTWVNSDAPDHAPDSVKAVWEQMQTLCEPRAGHPGLEGGEVELLTP